jgi:hypothetical protein
VRFRAWLGRVALALAAVAAGTAVIVMQHRPLLADDFSGPNGLVTNEFAYFNAGHPAAVRSPTWIVTSGSLFAHDNTGWTGVPDRGLTGPRSASATDSSVFRAVTRRSDFQNVTVSFGLLVSASCPRRMARRPGGKAYTYSSVTKARACCTW